MVNPIVPVPSVPIYTVSQNDTVLGVENGVVKRFVVSDMLTPAAKSADLAASSGASNIGLIRSSTGAQSETLADWVDRSTVYAFDFLTSAEITAIKANTAGDMLAKLQAAINASIGKRFVINAAPWKMIPLSNGSPNFGLCLDIPSDSYIEFEPGAEIQLLQHNNTIYQMMRIWDRTNVTIIRPRLNGRKDLNLATTGEFGMGIDIRGGSNIRVEYPVTNNTWGDGIYIGETVTSSPKNVYILSHVADACRRQGMSIVAADGVVVDSPRWSNISGTLPSAGLDIEPDNNSAHLKAIRIINPVTENCAGPGILVALQLLAGPLAKTVDIVIDRHRDTDSVVGFVVNLVNTNNGTYTVNGSIVSTDPVYVNSKNAAFSSSEYDALGPSIQLIRPKVINCNRSAQTAPSYGSPFVVLRDTGSVATYPIGNVQIINPTVTLTSGTIPKLFFFRDVVAGTGNLDKIIFENPLLITGVTVNNNGGFYGKGRLSDTNAQMGNETGSTQGNYGNYGALVSSNTSTSFDLSDTLYLAGGPDIIIRQPYSTSCIVRTGGTSPGTGNFTGLTVGQRLQANGKPGAYLRLRPLGSNVFMIIENVGPWSVI